MSPNPAAADLVYLKNGNSIEGEIVEESPEAVRLKVGEGTVGIARSEIKAIEEKPWVPPVSAAEDASRLPSGKPSPANPADWLAQAREWLRKLSPSASKNVSSEKIPVKKEAAYPWFSGGSGYAQAVGLQNQTGAPILLYFFTTWCPYCKLLDSKVLASEKVGQALSGVIKVRINAEAETRLASQYQVSGYPTVLALHQGGFQKVRRIRTGRGNPDDFLAECRRAGLPLR